jgi:hypothetical protein
MVRRDGMWPTPTRRSVRIVGGREWRCSFVVLPRYTFAGEDRLSSLHTGIAGGFPEPSGLNPSIGQPGHVAVLLVSSEPCCSRRVGS